MGFYIVALFHICNLLWTEHWFKSSNNHTGRCSCNAL